MVDLAEAQALQDLAVDVHERVQGLHGAFGLELLGQPGVCQLVAELGEAFLGLCSVMGRVVALRGPEEDALLEVQLEDLAPDGQQLPVCAAVRVRQVGDFLAQVDNLAVHAVFLADLEGFQAGELRGELGEELGVGGKGNLYPVESRPMFGVVC